MAFVKTRGGKIFYHVKGKGPAILLIRGLGRWSVHWGDLDKILAKQFTVVTTDLRGLGQSTLAMRPWHSVEHLADDLALILRQERIPKASVLGCSLGGMVAMSFAVQYPDLIEKLIVVNSSIGRSGHSRLTHDALQLLLKAPILKENMYPPLARLLLAKNASPEAIKSLSDEWRTLDAKQPMPIATVTHQLLAALRFSGSEKIVKIAAPTLIVSSIHDQFVPRGNSLYLHNKIPGAKLVNLENAGHEPHLDKPEVVARIVGEFMREEPLSS